MSTTAIIVVVVVVAVLLLVGIGVVMGRHRSRRRDLQEQFGPEYDHTVATTGSPKAAEAELRARVDERQQLALRPLSVAERDRYFQEWRQIQAQFVDQPSQSLAGADDLVTRVMRDSGYPMDDFEHRTDLISVDHPDVVQHYRRAHEIHTTAQAAGRVSTEDVRQALVSYRWLFAELLGPVETPSNQSSARAR